METKAGARKIAIVGAGFSGLTLAALLAETELFDITVFEKKSVGGVINASSTAGTLFENAAPSLLNHHEFENFAARFGVRLQPALPAARKRFLFVKKAVRWPLGILATLNFLYKIFRFVFLKNKSESLSGLTLQQWSELHFGEEFTEKILRTAMLGIYAGAISELSAELVLSRFFAKNRQKNRARLKGSVLPEGGLTHFLKIIKAGLLQKNVRFVAEDPGTLRLIELQQNSIVVFATSYSDFVALVAPSPENFIRLENVSAATWCSLAAKVTSISLAKVHLLLPDCQNKIDGFGMLFHPEAGFQSLGVIANSRVFPEYGPAYNESWILKCTDPATDPAGAMAKVLTDRERLFSANERAKASLVSFNSNIYPLYDKNLLSWLAATRLKPGYFATGNYWGALGLTQIFLQNQQVCESLKNYVKN